MDTYKVSILDWSNYLLCQEEFYARDEKAAKRHALALSKRYEGADFIILSVLVQSEYGGENKIIAERFVKGRWLKGEALNWGGGVSLCMRKLTNG